MAQSMSRRNPFASNEPFTEETHRLVDAYARHRGLPATPGYFVGDASVIVLVSDVLLERGTPSWDACDVDVVRAASAVQNDYLAKTTARAIVSFLEWRRDDGRVRGESIDAIRRHAEAVSDHPDPPTLDLSAFAGPLPNRSERRWRARMARRMGRH